VKRTVHAHAPAIAIALAVTSVSACSHEDVLPLATRTELRDDMRELWTAHVVWSRVVVIDTLAGLPDSTFATDRLIQSEEDIGDALRPYHGDAFADRLTTLLYEHVAAMAAVVAAVQSGESARIDPAIEAWQQNADDIAKLLAEESPHWKLDDVRAMMRVLVDLTTLEVMARAGEDWPADVDAYDAVAEHALTIGDVFAHGIAARHPRLVVGSSVSTRDEELHLAMRALWQDHVGWTRFFLISALAGLPDAEHAAARLLENQDDIGAAFATFYGEEAGAELLREHIAGAAEVVEAAASGDDAALQVSLARWYENGDEIAAFVSAANPHLPLADMEAMMRTHLDQTVAEASARIAEDWAADVAIYDEIVVHILGMADTLTLGLVAQFPDPEGSGGALPPIRTHRSTRAQQHVQHDD
jgi:hypothetical protein